MRQNELALRQLLNRNGASRRQVATAGKSSYVPFKLSANSELPYLAALCNEACLELNPFARQLYVEIVAMMKRPKITEIFSKDLIADTECLDCQDFKDLESQVSKYILKVFNHRDFADKPRIDPANKKAWQLPFAVTVTAGVESMDLTFAELDQKVMGDYYRVMQNKTNSLTNRADRARRKRLKAVADKIGLNLIHEDSRYELAKLWYVARVIKNNLTVASQLTEYEGHVLPYFAYPGTAHNKIRPFDIATGYSA